MNVLETKRLRLRHLDQSDHDAAFILELLNEPAFIRFVGDRGLKTREDARRYIAKRMIDSYQKWGFGLYAVEGKGAQEAFGICGLVKRDTLEEVDLGFAFLARFRGMGYASEASQGVLAYARDHLHLKTVAAITSPDNQASMQVLIRNGFRFDRRIRLEGEAKDVNLFLHGLRDGIEVFE